MSGDPAPNKTREETQRQRTTAGRSTGNQEFEKSHGGIYKLRCLIQKSESRGSLFEALKQKTEALV